MSVVPRPGLPRRWARRWLLVVGILGQWTMANRQHRSCPPLRTVVTRVSSWVGVGSSAEKSLTVTALSSSTEGVLVLRVVGDVDLATVGPLRGHVDEHLSDAHRGVVLDCTAVSFLAACGIGLLVEIADQARADGRPLRLVAHSPLVLRALEVTGTNEMVPHTATVAEAIAQCST